MRAVPIIAANAMLSGGAAVAQTAPPVTRRGDRASPLISSGIDRNTVPAETQVLNSNDLKPEGTFQATIANQDRRRPGRFIPRREKHFQGHFIALADERGSTSASANATYSHLGKR